MSLAVISMTALPTPSLAQDTVARELAYRGQLDLDGEPYTGSIQMRFRLYTDPVERDGDDCAADPACVWEEEHPALTVHGGQFAARLGSSSGGIEALMRTDQQYFIELGVRDLAEEGAEPDAWTRLANRHRLSPAGQALWSANVSENFAVRADLAVGRDVTIARQLSVGGDVRFEGDLQLVGGTLDLGGSVLTRMGRIESDLTIARNTSVEGDLAVAGELAVGGTVELPEGSITSRNVRDGDLRVSDLRPQSFGAGLDAEGEQVTVNAEFVRAQARAYVRENCFVQIGWRDRCDGCNAAPAKRVTFQANGQCVGGSGGGNCRQNNQWGAFNTDGDVNGDDDFYVRFHCN